MNNFKINSKVAWICFIVAMIIYVTMLNVTLPTLAGMAGGLPAFDMRPFGYSVDEARAYLRALSDAAYEYYIGRQLVLDIFYPPLLSISIYSAAIWCWSRLNFNSKYVTSIAAVTSISITLFDYAENIAVYNMLTLKPLSAGAIEWASLMTIAKSCCTMLAFAGLACLLAVVVWHWIVQKLRDLAASSK